MIQDLRGILVFREVARSGGFSSAARQINVTPAAVSRSIARLEGELGVRLFNRTTTEFHLTAEGAALAAAINGSLDSLHHALDAFSANRTALAGTLRLSLTNSHGKFYILPQLPRFFEMYPNIRLQIGFSDLRDHLVATGFDVGTCYGQPDDANYVSRVICRPQLLAVASPAYLAKYGNPRAPSDLAAHHCINIQLGAGPSAAWEFLRAGAAVHVHHPDDRVVMFGQIDGVGQAAVAGLGITVCHALAVLPELRSQALQCVLTDYEIRAHADQGDVYVYFPHREHIAARVRAFVDFLAECPRPQSVDAKAFAAPG